MITIDHAALDLALAAIRGRRVECACRREEGGRLAEIAGGLGLVLVMTAFVGALGGQLQTTRTLYLVLNGIGAGILAWYSAYLGIWVFLVLEGVWSVTAFWYLARVLVSARAQRHRKMVASRKN